MRNLRHSAHNAKIKMNTFKMIIKINVEIVIQLMDILLKIINALSVVRTVWNVQALL